MKEYQKLTGSKKGFLIGKYTLWQGPDHLLQIYSRFGVEEYKRFYFNDIQAVIIRKTPSGTVQNILAVCLALIFVVPAIAFEGGWSLFYAIIAAAMFVLLMLGLFKGPTCETKLMTAVQTEQLKTLHRLTHAARMMDRLRVQIHQTQGAVKPDGLSNMPAQAKKSPPPNRRAPRVGSKMKTPREEEGRAHMVLFCLLLTDGVLVGSGFVFNHVILTIVSSVVGLCLGIFVIIALVKQHDSSMAGSIKALTWSSLGFISLNFAADYVLGIVYAMRNPDVVYNQWEMFKSMSLLSPWESPLKLSFDIFSLCGALILGLPGLAMVCRRGGGSKAKASPAAAISAQQSEVSRKSEPG